MINKLKDIKFLANFSKLKKEKKKKIILCHGDFDFLHLGHIKHLKAAKKIGDYLIVSITGDKFMTKGYNRPIYTATERAEFLSTIDVVDYVYIDNNISAENVISQIKPSYFVKGNEYENLEKDLSGNIKKERKTLQKVGGKIVFTDEKTFSSSSLLNISSLSKDLVKKIKTIKKLFSYEKICKNLKKMKNKKILIIGDTIIDKYIYVSSLGRPSKENIIASLYEENEIFLGGVFASVGNLSSYSNKIDVITTVGKEKEYEKLIKKNVPKNINKLHLIKNESITTKKTRFVDKTHSTVKKLYEIYNMDDFPINKKIEDRIFNILNKDLKKYDIVLVNDYGHGLLTNRLIKLLTKKSKFLCVNAQINAGNKGYNLINRYQKGNYYCLDLNEARMATKDKYMLPKKIPQAVLKLCNGKNISLTMGSKGSISTNIKKELFYTPSFTNTVIDTISAGDAYFTTSAMVLYLTKSLELSSFIGNLAGAITVGVRGCVPLNKNTFMNTLNSYLKT